MKFLYIGNSHLDYSVNAVYISGLRQNGVAVVTFTPSRRGLARIKELKGFCFQHKDAKAIIVGYDSPFLVVLAKIIVNKPVVYNALCSVYERMIVSRGVAQRISLKAYYYWLLDFLACRYANLIMLETSAQIEYFKKLFKVSGQKCFLAWTGVEPNRFSYNPKIKKYDRFTVVFRGRILPEAGADLVIHAAKALESEEIDFVLIGNGREAPKIEHLIQELAPKNVAWHKEHLPLEQLQEIMQKSHLSLGQLADHERVQRTIPHKAYESLALGIPYLTADAKGIKELLQPNENCLVFKPGNVADLVDKIRWAKDHYNIVRSIGEHGRNVHHSIVLPDRLARLLLKRVKEFT